MNCIQSTNGLKAWTNKHKFTDPNHTSKEEAGTSP